LKINGNLNMRMRNLIIASIALIGGVSTTAWAVESPAINNPLGLGTVPPSAYKSGLIPSLNTVNPNGNLVVTGDVGGGKYFRGIVPYRGVTDFSAATSGANQGTVQVEKFMRDSTITPSGQNNSGLTPYYSPVFTVSKIPTGSGPSPQGEFSSNYFGSTRQQTGTQPRSSSQNGQTEYLNTTQFANRPLLMSRQDMQRMIDADITKYPLGGTPVIKGDSQGEFWRQMGITMGQKPEAAGPESSGPIRPE
jgi:hypothetical protein